jgi:phage baseplate assembly protein W
MKASRYRAAAFVIPGFDDTAVAGLRLDGRGRLATVNDAASIRQALLLLLSTRPGERVGRPGYGCHLWRLAFEGADDTTAGLAKHYVTQAVETWEKRVRVLDVVADIPADDPSLLEVRMTYRIQSTLATERVAVAVPIAEARP